MTQDEIMKMAHEAGLHIATDVHWMPIIGLEYAEKFAKLVAEAERKEMQAKIETLHAMYELAVKQRDYLMDQERAQVAAMRGRVQ
jgi:polysaccharide pyruvyl transferase WcaK-like protein